MNNSTESRDFTVLDSKVVFKGRRITVYRDKVTLPNERDAVREVVRSPAAIAVVAFVDEENIVLLRQFRYPVGKWIYEIPAGTLEKGESPEVCAVRELEEETGYRAQSVKLLTRFYTSPGFCDEEMFVYLAEKLTFTSPKPEDNECLEAEKVPLGKAIEMIKDGKITDGKTIAALGLIALEQS
ncbi:MAG: NUDIX hydrolase [Planctomycetota bacterium]|nr:MAG: NUDIX hydrolase [Planctomycetota bacterium]